MNNTQGRVPLKERQAQQMKYLEEQQMELRKTIEMVAGTKEGETFLRYLFLLSGGDNPPIAYTAEKKLDKDQILLLIGRSSFYRDLRYHMTSDTISKIERHNWEGR